MSTPLLRARPGPLAAFSAAVPGGARAALWPGPALLDGSLSGTRRARALAATPRHPARQGLGRLRARAPPGPPARPEVPGPLHASGGHLQPPARRPGGWPGDLPLQGLPARPPPAHPDTRGRGIPAAADAPRPPARVPTDPPPCLPGPSGTPGGTPAVPRAAGTREGTPGPRSGPWPQDA